MSSSVSAPVVLGRQEPEFCSVPPYVSSWGEEAVELARMAGLALDPWQEFVLGHSLGEQPDGKFSAFEVGLNDPRQNGKGGILEARELAGLYLFDERLIIHSAHEFATSLEAFGRLLYLIEDTPDLDRLVMRVSRAHGEEGIELKGRRRIRFRTRTKGGGRGFSGDLLIFDEAMFLPETAVGALVPTLSSRPNPQVWYVGSAVDQLIHDHGTAFARVRQRGLSGKDPDLAYFEWSAGVDLCDLTDEMAGDPEVWARANPALGRRISLEHIARERKSMDARTFAVERLGAGDWPNVDEIGDGLNLVEWLALREESSSAQDPVCFAYDVRPDRGKAAIGVAGRRSDGTRHVEVIDHRNGTGWVPERLAELTASHRSVGVLCDGASPAASLVAQLRNLGVTVDVIGSNDHAQACGLIFDGVKEKTIHHLGTPELNAAVKGAVKRPLGDAWAWSRKSSAVDISPLVAVTLALLGLERHRSGGMPMAAWA